jgi:hypothetical protein
MVYLIIQHTTHTAKVKNIVQKTASSRGNLDEFPRAAPIPNAMGPRGPAADVVAYRIILNTERRITVLTRDKNWSKCVEDRRYWYVKERLDVMCIVVDVDSGSHLSFGKRIFKVHRGVEVTDRIMLV